MPSELSNSIVPMVKSKLKSRIWMKLEFNFCFQWVLWKKSPFLKTRRINKFPKVTLEVLDTLLSQGLFLECRSWVGTSTVCQHSSGVRRCLPCVGQSLWWVTAVRVPLVPGGLQFPATLRDAGLGQSSTMAGNRSFAIEASKFGSLVDLSIK